MPSFQSGHSNLFQIKFNVSISFTFVSFTTWRHRSFHAHATRAKNFHFIVHIHFQVSRFNFIPFQNNLHFVSIFNSNTVCLFIHTWQGKTQDVSYARYYYCYDSDILRCLYDTRSNAYNMPSTRFPFTALHRPTVCVLVVSKHTERQQQLPRRPVHYIKNVRWQKYRENEN